MKKRADGRVVKTITDSRTGRRIFFYGKTEREVNQKLLNYNSRAKTGRNFSEIAREWWNEETDSLEYQSIKTYRPAMNRAIEYFDDISVKNIKPKDITQFLKSLARKGYAQKTIANQKLVVNLILQYAVLQNDLEINPCSAAIMPKDTTKTIRTAASANDEDIVRKSSDVWLFPFIAIMTGMRKGEILALQWKDINFENNFIQVTKSVYHEGDQPKIKKPKTDAGVRIVPLLSPLRETLLNIKEQKPEDYIISDTGKTPLTNRRYTTLWKHYKEKTGVTCTAHQLRHSFATIAFECGIPAKSVQEILGHKQLSTTMDLYTDFRKKSFDEAVNALDQFMAKS